MIADEENYYCLAEAVHCYLVLTKSPRLNESLWNSNNQIDSWNADEALKNELVLDLFNELNSKTIDESLDSLNEFLNSPKCVKTK